MTIRMEIEVHGAKKLMQNIDRLTKELKRGIRELNNAAATEGLNKAQRLAPYYTGETYAAIIKFKKSGEVWVIQSNPPADHPDFPVNLIFETGEFGEMTMWGSGGKRVPFKPKKTKSIHFWTKTLRHLQGYHGQKVFKFSKKIKEIWEK